MAYKHIQCIAYQVPTVAKVTDTTPPGPSPIIPTEIGVPQPSNSIIDPIDNSKLKDPPPLTGSFPALLRDYLEKLIGYLEKNPGTTNTEIAPMITYLKYHTKWGNWTIPSGAGALGNANVNEVTVNNKKAYTLKGYDTKTNLDKYLTDLDTDQDAKNRVIRFLNVLYKASQSAKIDPHIKTLKVFTAPEFYFRPEATVTDSNIYRAYTETVYKAIKEVLRQTIKEMNLNHWLIVPGTIMWYMDAGTTKATKNLKSNTYFNSCIYIYNRTRKLLKDVHTSHKLEKAKASHIDGVPHRSNAWDYGANAPKALDKYRNEAHLKKHLFTINGVKTGLEICLEHKMFDKPEVTGIIAKQVVYNQENDYSQRCHLQLLVAGGMRTNLPSIALKNKGVFFRNDGLKNESVTVGVGPTTENRYVDAAKNAYTFAVPTTLTNMPVLNANEIPLTGNGNAALELQSPVTGTLQLTPNFSIMPFDQQKIKIFPTQQI